MMPPVEALSYVTAQLKLSHGFLLLAYSKQSKLSLAQKALGSETTPIFPALLSLPSLYFLCSSDMKLSPWTPISTLNRVKSLTLHIIPVLIIKPGKT